MFDKRRDWTQHEMEDHRAHLTCPVCSCRYTGRRTLEKHLHNVHRNKDPEYDLSDLPSSELQSRAVLTASMCLFCDNWADELTRALGDLPHTASRFAAGSPIVTDKQLSTHVGRHMEQLSLFALPRNHVDDGRLPLASKETLHNDSSGRTLSRNPSSGRTLSSIESEGTREESDEASDIDDRVKKRSLKKSGNEKSSNK